jgi:RND superfamily putative drug exporter
VSTVLDGIQRGFSAAGRRLGGLVESMVSVGHRYPRRIIAGWLILAAALTVFVTPLSAVVERSATAFLPDDAPTLKGLRAMDSAFGTGRTSSYVIVVVVARDKLDDDDQALYERLVSTLRSEPERVSEVQSYVGDEQARKALTSKDGKATYISVGLPAAVGSPQADEDVDWLRRTIADLDPPAGTKLYVTGDPAMISDLTTAVNEASNKVTGVTVALLLVILWLVYRRWAAVLVPLATIGVALVCARGILALAGEHGVSLSSYTDAFVIAITLGAGTDYCVFLISRFREEFAVGRAPSDAVAVACRRVGPALVASAATVILGAISLSFADLAIFSTTGPAMAISVAVTVAISLTLAPALLSLFGHFVGPGAPEPGRRWAWVGGVIERRPARVLLASTSGLLLLAAFAPTMTLTFDERSAQPADTPSNLGLAALADHFPRNEALPDYLLITSDHDMRTSRDLAVLNAVSVAVSKVPSVDLVRSITQPAGTPLKSAVIADQLGDIASGLQKADDKLKAGRPDLERLASGTNDLDSALAQITEGAERAADGSGKLSSGTGKLASGLSKAADGTSKSADGAQELRSGAARLAGGLEQSHAKVTAVVDGMDVMVRALNRDLICTADPVCARVRKGLRQIADGQRRELLPGLAEAAQGARKLEGGSSDLAGGLSQIADGLQQADDASRKIAAGQEELAEKLGQLAAGSGKISTGTADLARGVNKLVDQTGQLQRGVGKSADYLDKVNKNANTPTAGGFYLPAEALDNADFARARGIYLSESGRVARIQIIGTSDPLTRQGQERYEAVRTSADQAIRHTALETSSVEATGAGGLGADLKQYLFTDAKMVVGLVLLVVLLVLILSLRALVAPLYLLVSVVLSTAAALGLTTLVFQHLGGTEIGFTVPVMVFVLLVAVGADYNILLMSRMRENGLRLTRGDVARAVIHTGPVITAAGVIFAATFVALLFSPLTNLAQIGFAVASGLLLDTFVVRSLVVPACAALLEDRNWWPSVGTEKQSE